MKIALVYDRVNKWGGAERVLLALHEVWPEAPLFTSVYNSKNASWAKEFKVTPSFLQKFPFAKQNHEIYPLIMPMAFESFDFSDYDVIISVTSEAAKGIITKPNQLHICYCLTPTRYLWSGYNEYFNSLLKRSISRLVVSYLRKWDKVASRRPDVYVAISKTVQSRVKNYYHREAEVIYPPVDVDKFQITSTKYQTNSKFKIPNSKYYLVVSRLVKYKKVDLVINTFNRLGWNLKIIGTGAELSNLKKLAKNNVEFLGQLTDKELLGYYQNCQALIFPQNEDFGLVAVEVQACGKPVIAYKAGGATETIIEGKTGLFFDKQEANSLIEKLKSFEESDFDKRDCIRQAEKFSQEKFKKEFKNFVNRQWQTHLKNTSML